MAKLFFHLLMKVNHVIVANFYIANMSYNAIGENKFSRKLPNLQYKETALYGKYLIIYILGLHTSTFSSYTWS